MKGITKTLSLIVAAVLLTALLTDARDAGRTIIPATTISSISTDRRGPVPQ